KVASYFQESAVLSFAEAEEKQLLAELKKAVQAEEVRLEYLVKNKNQVKTIRYVRPLLSQEDYEQLQLQQSKTAVRKQELLQQLATLAYLPVKYYTERKISTSVLNQAQEQGWLAFEEVEAYRDPFANQTFEKTARLALNESQKYACDMILQANQTKEAKTFLLEGITGSGKTEVYLQIIDKVLKNGQTAMMLVPEISLTPQMVERFKGRFGDLVAVLHSGLSQGEKYDE